MRRIHISLSILFLSLAVPLRAFPQDAPASSDSAAPDASADTSDLFLNAYMANEEGQKRENSGDTNGALEKYRYAASLLDQITRDDPKWQPVVVDYRKKRVSENIARLQQPSAPSTPDAGSVPIEGELPTKGPGPDLSGGDHAAPPPPAANSASNGVPLSDAIPSRQVRRQIAALQDALRESKEKLKSVESEKSELADKLNDTLKQLDQTKVNVIELKAQLRQTQDSLRNASLDNAQPSALKKQYEKRIAELQDALQNAEADREAADEQNEDYARRAGKAKAATALIAQQRDEAIAHGKDLQTKFADASKLAAKLDAANKEIAALTKDRDDATERADDLNKQLASTSKTAARLVAAQKEIAALKAGDTATAAKNAEVASQLADARKQIDQITADRDAAQKQITTLNGKLTDARTEIASVKADRDQIAAQRDQALAELGKAKAAEKRVNELLAENTTLTQKLAADDTIIKNFKSNSPEKDKQIAELRKEVSDTKALLTSTQKERDDIQATLNDLQTQYDSTTAELTDLKANRKVSDGEKKTLTDENGLLRGIVLRELRQEAGRDQARRLVMQELAQLNVQSDTLLQRINYLGQPVVQLTDREKSLFKDPSIDIPDADDSTMQFSIAAPRQTTPAPVVDTVTSGGAPKSAPAAGSNTLPPEASVKGSEGSASLAPETPADAKASPAPATSSSAPSNTGPGPVTTSVNPASTPMELASRTADTSAVTALSREKPSSSPSVTGTGGGSTTGSAAAGSGESSSTSSGSPMVPPDLMSEARDAKEAFERQDYRNAERIYEKMLTTAPNNVYILSNLGVVYFRNEKWKLAEESLKKAIAVAPEDTFSHCTLGIVYYQEKRYDDAINSLTRALAINPKYAVAHNYLGITASQKGWQEAAKKELETAIDLDPNYGDACFNLAVVYAMQQPPDKELARKYYERAVQDGAEPDQGLEQLVK